MRAAIWALLLAVYLAAPHCMWKAHQGLLVVTPAVTSGDEPHYLLMVNSLLHDHDLILGPDYQRVARGGAEAGTRFRSVELDHHTILVDPRTGRQELWQRVFDRDAHLPGGGFRRLQEGFEEGAEEVAAHPPAFSALVALLALPFRPSPARAEPLAISAVALFSFLALAALFAAARQGGFSLREAIAAVLLAGVCSSMLAYSRSFFSEPLIALALALALWAFAAQRPRLAGAACFTAAAIKPPFGLIALGWAALLWHDGQRREARSMLEVFFAGCAMLVAFNLRYAHTFAVSGNLGFVPAQGLGLIGDLFFSNAHGLLCFVPWTAVGLWFAARAALAPRPTDWPLLRAMIWGGAPVLLIFCVQAGDAGFCYGPRYMLPFVPWLALATVASWRQARRPLRAATAALACLGLLIAVPGALRYRDLFARPVTESLPW